MRVLALASHPVEAAATRYRLVQFVDPLAERGIALEVRPFLDSRLFASIYRLDEIGSTAAGLVRAAIRRLGDVSAARRCDVLFVQREAMIFGPPLIEWLTSRVGKCPLVLDLDDATYVPYTSPTYGRLAGVLKSAGKTDRLIRWATAVTCGNRTIAEYVRSQGTEAVILPTVADPERFRPADPHPPGRRHPPVLGWVGSHSTYPYLESIFPALQDLARSHSFHLKIVGSGRKTISIPGVSVEALDWSLEREVQDFQSFDVGLYPIVADAWSAGKSGFKAIQYMAVGIPFVVTPVGGCAEIGEPDITHYCTTSRGEWCAALSRLLADPELRSRMGQAGRRHATRHYTVPAQVDILAQLFRKVAGRDQGRIAPLPVESGFELVDRGPGGCTPLHQDAEVPR